MPLRRPLARRSATVEWKPLLLHDTGEPNHLCSLPNPFILKVANLVFQGPKIATMNSSI